LVYGLLKLGTAAAGVDIFNAQKEPAARFQGKVPIE
jgi:hypothetical protein